ncbi:MAG: SDR family NAD(P)-dependent oxidoreductase [Pseudomonadota bacterium]
MSEIAIVTGGAQGIGLACAKRLLAKGARVALWDFDQELAQKTAKDLGPEAVAIPVDIASFDSVTEALAQTETVLGAPSILVNSAGVAGPNMPIEDYPLEDWAQIFQINSTGSFHMLKALLPGMKARNYGRVVLIASVAGKEGNPMASAYSASKAAVIALTKSAGKETAAHNIAVNCITPAAAKTRIFDQMSQEHIDYMLSKIPRGRFVEVDEIAHMVAWLTDAENSFTTGAAFDLSGGRATF